MSFWDEEEQNKEEDLQPSDWNESEDEDAWKQKAQEEIDNPSGLSGYDDDDNDNDEDQDGDRNRTDNLDTKKDGKSKKKVVRARAVSRHFNVKSSEPLSDNNAKWILIKSIILWIYLLGLSIGIFNNNSPQTIWFISYIILLLFWCLFFRLTASASLGGFYPFLGNRKQQLAHTLLFIFGLGGIAMYFLEKKKVIMRECIMQYKIVEFSILWFAYFISLSWELYPWSSSIDEVYINWSTGFHDVSWWQLVNTIPVLLLLMDSIVHYSKVYHEQYWYSMSSNCLQSKFMYITVLFILYLDTVVRGLLLILFVKLSLGFILFFLAGYVGYLIFVWLYALSKSMSAPVKQFKLTMKKSGGKLISAILISFWSVSGLMQILPTIKSNSSSIQQQQRIQGKWGKNIIRFECWIRLIWSVVLFTKFWIMRNFKFGFEEKVLIYVINIIFALYPYSMEILFQTPLSLLCRGSFFLVHHIDTLTSLPNIYRFNKDIKSKLKWKFGIIITNIRKFNELNNEYGIKCGDITLTRFMQRIVFEIEDYGNIKMKLYRIKDDRFLIVTAIPTDDEFKEFVQILSKIEIIVQRPSDYDENDKKNQKKHKKNDDANNGNDDGDNDVENQGNDDFINPNANSGYGAGAGAGGGGDNWFDDDDDGKNDDVIDGKPTKGGTLKASKIRRRASTYNRNTANDSKNMSLRIAGSYGPWCTLQHALSLDNELQENDSKGQIQNDNDKYLIVELKDKFAE